MIAPTPNSAIRGDALDVLPALPDECIDLCFTSPPYYNTRAYAHYASYADYLTFLSEVFRQVHRITREGRFLVVNTSPVIDARKSRAHQSIRYPIPFDLHGVLARLGWTFIDDIVWVKPEPSVVNRNAGFARHRKPLAYKPNAVTEYVMVYRKATEKLIDWNIRQYDESRTERSRIQGRIESTNVWQIAPASDPVHNAVFPNALAERVIQYYSYVGDLILDPFAGSGTVGDCAFNLDRKFLLIERNKRYFQHLREKLDPVAFWGHTFMEYEHASATTSADADMVR